MKVTTNENHQTEMSIELTSYLTFTKKYDWMLISSFRAKNSLQSSSEGEILMRMFLDDIEKIKEKYNIVYLNNIN